MIRTLNLDGLFTPVQAPEIEYNLFRFPGGEWHIKLNNNIDYSTIDKVVITHRVNSMEHFMQILIAKDALEIKGVKHFELFIPYIPYARQDRAEVNGESFTLKVFAKLLNSAKFDKVIVLDAHSNVSTALIDNCHNKFPSDYIGASILNILSKNPEGLYLVTPDAGANKKYAKIPSTFSSLKILGMIKCDKTRNMETGELSGFEVFVDDLNGKPCLIIDDICDGGGTFIGLAQELKKKNCGRLYLYVSHGIFSKGLKELSTYYSIFTTNSISDINNDFIVKQFKIG